MSTELKSVHGRVRLTGDGAQVGVETTTFDGHYTTIRVVPRADFLAAVSSELNGRLVSADAIVIERGELPKVDPVIAGRPWCLGHTALTPDKARTAAAAYLALAEYLAAHPPVDEARLEVFRSLVSDAVTGLPWPDRDAIARRLVEAGVRVPEATA